MAQGRIKPPAFQFYAKEFLADANQAGMSLQETGAYARLMCFEWNEHGKGLPDDAVRCGRMVGATPAAMRKMWPAIRSCFVAHPIETGRIVHPRLEKERQKQKAYRDGQAEKGIAGAKARWQRPSSKHGRGHHEAMAKQSPEDGSPISDLRSPDKNQKQKRFSGERLMIFEWHHRMCHEILGKHAESFDLDAWYRSIDAKAVQIGQVIPKRDNGAWLETQLLAEVRRRGIPMPSARQERPFTDSEIRDADKVRFNAGGCSHDPKCENRQECIGKIIRKRRGEAA